MTCITKKILKEINRSYIIADYFHKLMAEEESYLLLAKDVENGFYDVELSAIALIKEAAKKKMEEYKSKQ